MKKLIKRLEEFSVENERLSTENSELRERLIKYEPRIADISRWFKLPPHILYDMEKATQEVKDKVFNELDKDEERPKTTSTYKELGSQPKELEGAKEILKDWRFGKCSYSSDEIDRAIETILKHLKK